MYLRATGSGVTGVPAPRSRAGATSAGLVVQNTTVGFDSHLESSSKQPRTRRGTWGPTLELCWVPGPAEGHQEGPLLPSRQAGARREVSSGVAAAQAEGPGWWEHAEEQQRSWAERRSRRNLKPESSSPGFGTRDPAVPGSGWWRRPSGLGRCCRPPWLCLVALWNRCAGESGGHGKTSTWCGSSRS